MVLLEQIKIGSTVVVRGGFGTESPRLGLVDEIEEDIKNGRPGITYTEIESGDPRWAYLNQVLRVESY